MSRRQRGFEIEKLLKRAKNVRAPRSREVALAKQAVEINGGKCLGQKQIDNVIRPIQVGNFSA